MKRKRWWKAWSCRRLRKIRDSCHGSAIQLWEWVGLHWIVIGWGGLIICFFCIIAYRLDRMPTREQYFKREMENLELIDTKSSPCKKH